MESSQVRVTQATQIVLNTSLFQTTDDVIPFLSTFTPNPSSTLADFNANRVAALDIAPVPVGAPPWITGVDLANRGLGIYSSLLNFTPAGTATFPILVGGVYIRDTGNTTLNGYILFNDPVTFDSVLDTLLVKPFIYADFLMNADVEFIDAP